MTPEQKTVDKNLHELVELRSKVEEFRNILVERIKPQKDDDMYVRGARSQAECFLLILITSSVAE